MLFPPLHLELDKFAAVMHGVGGKSGGKALQCTEKSCTYIKLYAFANILCVLGFKVMKKKSISPPPRTIHCMCYF